MTGFKEFSTSSATAEKPFAKVREETAENARIILAKKLEGAIPQETDFADKFSSTVIANDQNIVRILQEKFKNEQEHLSEESIQRIKEGRLRSEALEVIIIDFGELMEWFGKDAKLSRTTRFDDIVNGVDGIVEFKNKDKDPHRIALAIDASMKPELNSLTRKISRNVEKVIGTTTHAGIKYFASKINNYRGPLNFVVPTVVGIEGHNANELTKLFSDILRLEKKSGRTDQEQKTLDQLNEKAMNHPAQKIFLEEIKEQLRVFMTLLNEKLGSVRMSKREEEVTEKYRDEIVSILMTIDNVLTSKKHLDSSALENDGVYTTIQQILSDRAWEKKQ